MKDVKGELFNNGVRLPAPELVEIEIEKNDMNFFKKLLIKQALPFVLKGLDVNIDIDKDEDINVLNYKVDITLFGQTIFSREGAEVLRS